MTSRSPWAWVPTLYVAEGLPYVLVTAVSLVLYQRLGVSNTEITLYATVLALPWTLKPLWSPLVDQYGTKRRWVLVTQALFGACLALLAFVLPTPFAVQASLAALGLLAFVSATHDVAADGLYMLGLPQHQQASFSGVRSTFYRLAVLLGEGQVVALAGSLEEGLGVQAAWAAAFAVAGAALFALFALHTVVLPAPAEDVPAPARDLGEGFVEAFRTFLAKPDIRRILAFLLLYRLAEAHLVKLIGPFLLDARADGGLGLSPQEYALAKGTLGVAALTAGGLLGGYVVSRHGLGRWLWPMVLVLHLPNLAFLALAALQPTSLAVVSAGVVVEQFGYGFGFTAYMLYMIHVADGPRKTAHYAIGTGIMALGLQLPGLWSGWLSDRLGYVGFFAFVMLATIPGFVVAAVVRFPADFGRKA